ncbi:MAG: decarboxylating 6-phosphogluconate dehydrogenase [Actinomycetota bacterium]|nr:decarboxylating 6-phosphogluconate dehydrogenase [Actinomycetota bacterium]
MGGSARRAPRVGRAAERRPGKDARDMDLGMVGLGRMGANLTRRLLRAGHRVVVYDLDPSAVDEVAADGAVGTASLDELAAALEPPRAVWVMVPAGVTGKTVQAVAEHLEAGDTIIDGGNSNYEDDLARAAELEPSGITYLDIGTSGGVWGLERGFCLMIGGPDEPVKRLAPIFEAIAPGVDAGTRTPGREGDPSPAEQGWLHCGPTGAGHYVKMVHNGIEYGQMAALAEGLNILATAGIGREDQTHDAETAPLRHPELHRYDIPVAEVAEVWRRGSVIASWLLDLTASALWGDPHLDGYAGHVSDSGEGRWTVQTAIEQGVPAPVLSAALFQRFSSRGNADLADKALSAMRAGFGGHLEKTVPDNAAPSDGGTD